MPQIFFSRKNYTFCLSFMVTVSPGGSKCMFTSMILEIGKLAGTSGRLKGSISGYNILYFNVHHYSSVNNKDNLSCPRPVKIGSVL